MLISKIFYGISLVLLLIAFSLPWYSTSTSGDWHEKFLPSPFEQFFIGSEPYTGWDVLPLTAPSLIGFLLGAIVLFSKCRPVIAVISGFLVLIGVAIGFLGSPQIVKTWATPAAIHGTSWTALENFYIFAAAISVVFLVISFFVAIELEKERNEIAVIAKYRDQNNRESSLQAKYLAVLTQT